jgi:aspartate carbamoyltransferase catalytic subunit
MIRHLLSIDDLTPDAIERVLTTAASLSDVATRQVKKYPTLRGKSFCYVFLYYSKRMRFLLYVVLLFVC